MKNELNRSRQYYRSVGTLYELALKLEDCDCKYNDENGNQQVVKGERVRGDVALKTTRGIHKFNVYFQSIDWSGETSRNWKMATSMLEWNPEINGNGDEPTRVALEGRVSINDYPTNGTVYSNLRWEVSKATTKVGDDDPVGTTLDGIFYVHSITNEVLKDEETGRLKMTLLGANHKGACFPVEVIVEEDLADAVEDGIEVGTTVPVTLNRAVKRIGGSKKKSSTRAIGGAGDVETNTGFDVEEIILVGADEAIEEPLELEDEDGNPIEDKSGYINPATMKKALKVRNAMLEELKTNPPSRNNSGGNSLKERKARAENTAKSKSVGKGATKPPFDMDEDDDPDF